MLAPKLIHAFAGVFKKGDFTEVTQEQGASRIIRINPPLVFAFSA